MIRLTGWGAIEVEDTPITTDTQEMVVAIVASVQFVGFPEAKSSHRPFPPLEAPRIARPIAPINEGINRTKNAIKLRMRLRLVLRRVYFSTELGPEIRVRVTGA